MRRRFAAVFAAAGLYAFPGEVRAASTCPSPLGALVAIEGIVEFRDHPRAVWRLAPANVPLCPGAAVRVGDRSRATATLPDAPTYRIDQNTTFHLVSAPGKPERPALIRLVEGALYIFSRKPRTLEVDTPFVDAAVEGTEFLVRVEPARATVSVFSGTVRASNEHGEAKATAGQMAVAEAGRAPVAKLMVRPRDAVEWALHYPPILGVLADPRAATPPSAPQPVREAARLAGRGDVQAALERLDAVPAAGRGAPFHLYRAAILLSVGRVDEARADIDRALAQDPKAGLAYALRSVIAVAQNDNDAALSDGRRAVELEPEMAAAWIALSYAQQARFDLDGARDSLRRAVEAESKDALAWARLSELWLMAGRRDKARQAAESAADLAPDLARVQSVLGFAALAEFRTRTARQAFERALARDPADPTARFGLGLARIRQGDLESGRNDIEAAVALDPNRSLLRSYLGKAYFEERTTNPLTYLKELAQNFPNQENTLAAEQFAIAKRLDPKDPTPFLYDAIRLQSENRPVEALRDLEKSIELNDNRAVYRSRELLDQDRAARGTSLARIYNDLGFEQPGISEATRSLSLDPSSAAAHRFLSDVYAARPRHEIARASELLQAQLLQDININPVQPSLSETNLNIITRGGPARAGFNEFTPLFERNQVQLDMSGVVGTQATYADEVVVSALYDRYSISAGQLFYHTDGFRRNADSDRQVYNLFSQVAVTPKLNLQAEVRQSSSEQGDLSSEFSTEHYYESRRLRTDQDTGRLGLRFSPTANSNFLTSLIYTNRDSSFKERIGTADIFSSAKQDGVQGEAQYVYNGAIIDTIPGISAYSFDTHGVIRAFQGGDVFQLLSNPNSTVQHYAYYLYNHIRIGKKASVTLGGSYDDFTHNRRDVSEFNPKLGLVWRVFDNALFRAAAFQVVKPALVASQTIQPTQVAGFNQFYDDRNGTQSRLYGLGFDWRVIGGIYAGAEVSHRDLDAPPFSDTGEPHEVLDQGEDSYRLYLNMALDESWVANIEVRQDTFESSADDDADPPLSVETFTVPLSLLYFNDRGIFGRLGVTYVHQDVVRGKGTFRAKKAEGDGSFALVDLGIGYRFPNRRGRFAIEAINILDEDFRFQDDSFREVGRSEPRWGPYISERAFVSRFSLSF